MKYGRYLKEHQLEEWRRAYIDYRALKKLITAATASRASSLLQAQQRGQLGKASPSAGGSGTRPSPAAAALSPKESDAASPRSVETAESLPGDDAFKLPAAALDVPESSTAESSKTGAGGSGKWLGVPVLSTDTTPATGMFASHGGGQDDGSTPPRSAVAQSEEGEPQTNSRGQASDDSAAPLSPKPFPDAASPRFAELPSPRRARADSTAEPSRDRKGKGVADIPASPRSNRSGKSPLSFMRLGKGSSSREIDAEQVVEGSGSAGKGKRITWGSPGLTRNKSSSSLSTLGRTKWRFPEDMPLPSILPQLNDPESAFFAKLDEELEKVVAFYNEREDEAVKRFEILERQLEELAQHKRLHKEQIAAHTTALSTYVSHPTTLVSRVRKGLDDRVRSDGARPESPPPQARVGGDEDRKDFVRKRMNRARPSGETGPHSGSDADDDIDSAGRGQKKGIKRPAIPAVQVQGRIEPYGAAKSKLKLACFEFYRYLGMLRQYRSLNRTGFSKICKKMEKNTRIPCSAWYLTNKVNPSHFVASPKLDDLSRAIEDVFAKFFEHGNRKRALERLRVLGSRKTHHESAWRSGVMMGLAIPVLVDGIVKSFHPDTRAAIPYWPALLQMFAAEMVPTLFACLFGLNLLAYHRARINYVLIFEFDLRTVLDFRTFVEIPAFLMLALCYCFWLSFSNFWPGSIEPKAWPMVWLVIALVTMLNPFPFFYRSARWWLLRSLARVTTFGALRVEFRDFFLGDQLTSVYYAMYNLGFLVCLYHRDWRGVPPECNTNATWASPILGALPNMWRLGQSLRRYVDSDGNRIHAMNAGKYLAGVLYFFFYFNWRIKESRKDYTYALLIVFGIINSLCTSTWDLLMDWNVLNRNAKHFLLRNEIAYTDRVWFYYVAIVLDPILRFAWIMYLPDPSASLFRGSPSVALRGFVVTMCEVFRRFIWNFLRVESEHIGNVDGFRVTRDVPLPYTLAAIDQHSHSAAISDGEEDEKPPAMARLRSIFTPSPNGDGRLADIKRTLGGIDAGEERVKETWKKVVAGLRNEVTGKAKGYDSSSEEDEHDHQHGRGARGGHGSDRHGRGQGKADQANAEETV